jgi:hypothetical protein
LILEALWSQMPSARQFWQRPLTWCALELELDWYSLLNFLNQQSHQKAKSMVQAGGILTAKSAAFYSTGDTAESPSAQCVGSELGFVFAAKPFSRCKTKHKAARRNAQRLGKSQLSGQTMALTKDPLF